MSQMTNVAHNEHLECEVKATHTHNQNKVPTVWHSLFSAKILKYIFEI